MENETAKEYLLALLDHVFDLTYVRFFGPNYAEHIFLLVCKVLREREGLRSWYVDRDLICFLAHVLRWGEFKEIAISRTRVLEDAKHPAVGHRDFSELLLNSLEPCWEDRGFYESL